MKQTRQEMALIVGLGNPGQAYQQTRHNMGFLSLAYWCRILGVEMKDSRFHTRSATCSMGGRKIDLICPQTFMNRSGEAVRAWADYYGVETGDVLVLHDDLDLPLGRVKVAREGGAGGHKGILSIIQHMGDTHFSRVKIGIGRPKYDEPIENYVLSPFYSDETSLIENVIEMAVRASELWVLEGVESAMNHINCQHLLNKEEEKRCRD